MANPLQNLPRSSAVRFIVLIGLVSLFADVTYEGARSANGAFLALLGADAFTVALVAGSGELLGYFLRLFSGWLSDRTQRYWSITILGYALNLVAVPCLALAGHWPVAAALMILERVGKAVRTPARDAMLAHASESVGRGWGFALHEALDQIGAMTGPLIVSAVYFFRGDLRAGYAILLVPAVLALSVLAAARFLYPRPEDLETRKPLPGVRGFDRRYWMYLAGVSLVAAGYADFPLIAFHWEKTGSIPVVWIPVFYSVAMGVDALSSLAFGRLYDRRGLSVLSLVSLLSAFFAVFVFSPGVGPAVAGMTLWGIGMGAQESVLRAAVSDMTPREKRGTAFGVFNAGYGLAWFAGSALMGFLYDRSIPALVAFSVVCQLMSVPVFYAVGRKPR